LVQIHPERIDDRISLAPRFRGVFRGEMDSLNRFQGVSTEPSAMAPDPGANQASRFSLQSGGLLADPSAILVYDSDAQPSQIKFSRTITD
jgi:hypothetical protein